MTRDNVVGAASWSMELRKSSILAATVVDVVGFDLAVVVVAAGLVTPDDLAGVVWPRGADPKASICALVSSMRFFIAGLGFFS